MKQMSTYAVKIRQSADLRKAFSATAELYRNAVGFFIDVCMSEWDDISSTICKRGIPHL